MFKTEMHAHSAEVSNCGRVRSDALVRKYLVAGYTTLVLTNHLSIYTYKNQNFDRSADPWDDKIDFFIDGYKRVLEAAAGRLNVLLGVELRSNKDDNDYLIYGVDEAFLRSMPKIMDTKVAVVADAVRAYGGIIYQAHPFRNHMKIIKPGIADGIEVYNGHTGQESRNDIADLWADKFGMKKISGSDFHYSYSEICAGIKTASPITTSEKLIEVLKSGEYELICRGSVQK